MKKRVFSSLLCLCMAITLLPMTVLAEDLDRDYYSNTGMQRASIDANLDLRSGDHSGKTLAVDGYEWNDGNKTLTMQDLQVGGNIILPDADCTVYIRGSVEIKDIFLQDTNSNPAGNALTITGGTLNGNIDTKGDVTLVNTTVKGAIRNTNNGGDEKVLRLKDSTLTADPLDWSNHGGLALENSILTVSELFFVEKIVMDDNSVINMNTTLVNRANVPDGMSGIAQYLPAGYTLAKYKPNEGLGDTNNTILDSNGEMAKNITLKKQVDTTPTGGTSSGRTRYTLTFQTNEGSAIPVVTAAADARIMLEEYITTRSDYTFEGWYADEELTSAVSDVILTKNVTVYAKWSYAKKEEVSKFTDIPDNAYYQEAVEWAVEQGITQGATATTFNPDGICTRAQMVTFLWRAVGSPAPATTINPFADVFADDYYYNAVLWAIENGIAVGTSDATFSPDMNCTRGQMATFLWRTAGKAIVDGELVFADVAATEYYAEAVKWAVAEGITVGTSSTTFSPDADCTRAEIVTFLYRYLSK